MKILILNGPNLNKIGTREPEIYGTESIQERLESIKNIYPATELSHLQTNSEGEFIDILQEEEFDALIINPGAYSHYSIAIADALRSISLPKIEVHISNIHAREEYRKTSLTGEVCDAVISGLGLSGYYYAVDYLQMNKSNNSI